MIGSVFKPKRDLYGLLFLITYKIKTQDKAKNLYDLYFLKIC